MSPKNIFWMVFLSVFFATAIALASSQRDVIIQKQLDCMDQHQDQKGSVNWDDFCYTPEDNVQAGEDEHAKKFDKALDNWI